MKKCLVLLTAMIVLTSGCENVSNNLSKEEVITSVQVSDDENPMNEIIKVEGSKVSLLDGSIVNITVKDLLDEPGGNNPKKIILEHEKYRLTYNSDWNDGIHIKHANLDKYTGYTEIFLTTLGTDISRETNIYSCSGKDVISNGRFEHFSDDLYFDDQGNIYYNYDTQNIKKLNYYYNYKTGKSGEVTNEKIKEKLKEIVSNK